MLGTYVLKKVPTNAISFGDCNFVTIDSAFARNRDFPALTLGVMPEKRGVLLAQLIAFR